MAFNPGLLYKKYGYPEHKQIVIDRVRALVGQSTISLPHGYEHVEVFVGTYPENTPATYIIHLINLNGFNGSTFLDPFSVPSLSFELALTRKRQFWMSIHLSQNQVTLILIKIEKSL
jgi:hypothetical protein